MKWLWKKITNFFIKDTVPNPQPSKPVDPIDLRPPLKYKTLDDLPLNAKGVDISHHNKSVDLYELSKVVDFIYMKATEGRSFISSAYHSRASQLKTLGTLWGAYHYYKINVDPIVQAKHFVNFKHGWTLPPVLDIEGIGNDGYDSKKHTADLLKFLQYVEEHTGFVPVVYCGFYYARDVIKFTLEFAKYPLWIAWYTTDFSRVQVPPPWKEIKIWQFTEHGTIQGVNGRVDINKIVS